MYDRNHNFGLGPIPKPKPKLADTFDRYCNQYRNQKENLVGSLKQNLLPNIKDFLKKNGFRKKSVGSDTDTKLDLGFGWTLKPNYCC